ncbi:CBS domain-containing protein [Pradoshia sp. D12]|uniref:acetoin utilization AcuB family protein n=1 Tax=Bacillaceae TaxID=186817 RepID=UPI00111FB04A|nr:MULTISPECIES: acetoin utilization AcuB family protein [Bacillaceae]QFK72534.1 CBS domain-containing protein [Pradoshia sp. D12]TPF70722.1 CBS domain-containing protein [Bacillus sp. D12]
MIIEDIMIKDVITLQKNATLQQAIDLVKQKKIRHIPIVDDEQRLIGLLCDVDIRSATPSIFHLDEYKEDLLKPISDIMITDIYTAHPLDFVEEIAFVFYEQKISCMPVISDNKLVGIITETDLLHTYVELTGSNQPASQIEVKVTNKSGTLSEIAEVIKGHNSNVNSIFIYPYKEDPAFKVLVLRIQTMNPLKIVQDLRSSGYEVLWPDIPESTL